MSTNPPKKIRFPGQKSGEEVRLVIRKHWIIDVKMGIMAFTIAFLPFLLALGLGDVLWSNVSGDAFLIYLLGFFIYMLFVSLLLYLRWLNEELDLIIVTDQRIILHDQKDLFHRQISEANIAQVEDTKGIEQGFLGHIFHFGGLEITTSVGADASFVIKNVDRPYESARILLDLHEAYIEKNDAL